MNKQDVINAVAENSGLTKKDTEKVINALGETVKQALSNGDDVRFVGFGSFSLRERSAYRGHNPHTGEEITVPAAKVPVFKPGKLLKNAVN